MNNLAIIPARGGSIRIPNKNIKDFFGKPVIAYPIESAIKSCLFEEIMVSTDSSEIGSISEKFGASVPFYRSAKNSDNHATLADVVLEVLNFYLSRGRNFKSICCLLPTAALLTKDLLRETYKNFNENDFNSYIPVVRFSYPVQRALKNESGMLKFREPEHLVTRSQDLEPLFHDAGQFYWIRADSIVKERSFFTSKTGFMELSEIEAQDVDSITDWMMLELKYRHMHKNLLNS